MENNRPNDKMSDGFEGFYSWDLRCQPDRAFAGYKQAYFEYERNGEKYLVLISKAGYLVVRDSGYVPNISKEAAYRIAQIFIGEGYWITAISDRWQKRYPAIYRVGRYRNCWYVYYSRIPRKLQLDGGCEDYLCISQITGRIMNKNDDENRSSRFRVRSNCSEYKIS